MQLHRHRGGLGAGLVDGLGLLVQGTGLPAGLFLAGAEHVVAPLAHEIAVGEAVTGEHRLELLQLFPGGLPVFHQGLFVDAGDQGGVFGALHAALDLESVDAGLLQLLEVLGHAGVLQAQGIGGGAAGEAVLHPAGLGAQAPVARPSADGGGQIALAGIAHAQGAVDEHLDLHRAALADELDLPEGQLPGQHHPGEAQLFTGQNAGQVVDGHLGGGMDGQLGGQGADHPGHAQVLDDEGVGPQLVELEDELLCPHQFPVGDQGVHGHIGLDAPQAAVPEGVHQFFAFQIFGIAAGVVVAGAEIYRVGAAPNGGDDAFHGARRAHQFHCHLLFSPTVCCALAHQAFLASFFSRATSARRRAHSSA